MSRYFIELKFKGTNYAGWQKQKNALTIQEKIDKALTLLLKDNIETIGCGRTDAGVHARFFVAHFDCSRDNIEEKKDFFINKINSILPEDIAITNIYRVKDDAHARFDAISRTYEYTILKCKDPFENEFGMLCKYKIDLQLLNEASKILLTHNDFSCFCKLHGGNKTNICKITSAFWFEIDNKIIFKITSDRFLRSMVRMIVGAMIELGRGKLSLKDFKNILDSKKQLSSYYSVKSKGLTLIDVKYPSDIKLLT